MRHSDHCVTIDFGRDECTTSTIFLARIIVLVPGALHHQSQVVDASGKGHGSGQECVPRTASFIRLQVQLGSARCGAETQYRYAPDLYRCAWRQGLLDPCSVSQTRSETANRPSVAWHA